MADTSPERWTRIWSLFDEAIRLPVSRRDAFLEEACGGDVALQSEAQHLLGCADRIEGFPEKPLVEQARCLWQATRGEDSAISAKESPGVSSMTTQPPDPSLRTQRIGPYHLLQKVGEGGMGEVWLAEQTEPVRRKVALKLIKTGMDTRQVINRFEAERQALALMDHPAIAKVYDAGETPWRLPYFAMEYVAGEPLTVYCDRHRLPMAPRLELFARVCEGVQHAHQKGIIHRDLKPSNVLVAMQDGKPVPKIIDFGVAKATAQRLTEKTMFTELGVLIGTLEYMSPEQADLTALGVDTRTDVYALGVMLYELLTGALPFESKALREAGYEEMRRRIREVDPPRPSTRVATLGSASAESARNRATEPGRLAGQLRGDLDWITMKALEKDRTRRYGSPAELAADLGRYERHEPVLAGPPGSGYRARKFVRRHRVGVAAGAVVILALAGFGIVMAVQARRIGREYTRAEKVSEFLVNLFDVSDPRQARGNAVTAREILDKGVDRIQKELSGEPLMMAQLMLTMGRVYATLGLYEQAEPLVRRSLQIQQQLSGDDDPGTLASLDVLAWLTGLEGHNAEAERLFTRLVDARRKSLGASAPDTLRGMDWLATIYGREGRFADCEKLHRQVLETHRRILGPDHPDTLWSMNNVAADERRSGHPTQAEALYREALEARRRVSGPDHPDTLWAASSLAGLLAEMARYDEAEILARDTLEKRRRVLGETHPDTSASQNLLATILQGQGKLDEAEALYRKSYETRRKVLGEDHPSTISSMINLASLYASQEKYHEAEQLTLQALATSRRTQGDDHPTTLICTSNLGGIYLSEGRLAEADKILHETLEKQRRVAGEKSPDTLATIYNLGVLAALRGQKSEAIEQLRHAVDLGLPDIDAMAKDPQLKSLHGDPGFDALLAEAKGKK